MKKRDGANRRNPWRFLAPLLVFAVGAGIFLYPAFSNFMAEKNHKEIISDYENKVENQSDEERKGEWEKAEQYNENLAGDPVHDPFIMGSGYVLPDNYEQVLNINGDGVMGYLEIPKIDAYLPIYHGTSDEVLQKGVGHLEATALPIGGTYRHPVLSAHRGLPSSELFSRLDEMEVGDTFFLHILNETLAYEVDQIEVILPEALSLLAPVEGRDLVTLLTCTPYAVNTHRLLVRGSRTDYVKEASAQEEGKSVEDPMPEWMREYRDSILIGLFLLIVIGSLIGAIHWIRKRKRKS